MNAPTEYQTIYHDGQPAFVLVPVEDFEKMRAQLREPLHEGIPQAIVEANVIHGVSMIRAWREHLGLTQAEVAARANMKQPALARLERGEGKPRKTTLAKLAEAMGLTITQLEE